MTKIVNKINKDIESSIGLLKVIRQPSSLIESKTKLGCSVHICFELIC